MSEKAWWLASATLSALGLAALIFQWTELNRYHVDPPQLTSRADVTHYLDDHWERRRSELGVTAPTMAIETGIFVQSLEFFNSSDVNLTGYIWQHYRDELHDHLRPGRSEIGFILPDQVNSGGDIEPREIYRERTADGEVVGWYFEATLRQPFEYATYPFDHKTIWVRLWPRQFSGNVVLVPDLDAYRSTGPTDVFGIDENIVLGAWERENTYFDYKPSSYSTSFGIDGYVGQTDFPELRYNIVVRRRFLHAFVVHLLPLFLVAVLLYGAVLTISHDEALAARHGFSTSTVIEASSVLFFVVMLAHVQLREQFASTRIVYMEYFYFLMYGLLVAAAAYTYLFTTGTGAWVRVLHYRDNLVLKTGFWPVVFFAMTTLTAVLGPGE